jgi:hypothetical protein
MHPLIRDAVRQLRSRPADQTGIVRTLGECFDVRVSKASISRAGRILQALAVALEGRGYSITVKDGKTYIAVLKEPFQVFLKENTRTTIRELTADEHRRRRDGQEVTPYELSPSGELVFHVGDSYMKRGTSDGKRHRLEESLNRFIESLVWRALTEKARREQREREEQARQEAARRRKEEENRERHELSKRNRFDKLVAYWLDNENRRAFLAQLRRSIGEVPTESPLAEWLIWADGFVDVSDPLARFRARRATLTLYYCADQYEIARIKTEGFRDPDPPPPYSQEKAPPPGIKLQNQRWNSGWSSEAIELELREDLLLQYEVTKPGFLPRQFYVPAQVLNGHVGQAAPRPPGSLGRTRQLADFVEEQRAAIRLLEARGARPPRR